MARIRSLFLWLAVAASLPAQTRPGLFFREDWKETPAALPVTQEHVSHPNLLLSLHGPGAAGIKKSHHASPADDPYYIWDGMCEANCAISLRHRTALVDLTGQAKIVWRARQAGLREARILLKLGDGSWLVSDESDGPSGDWRVREFILSGIRWYRLDMKKVVVGARVEKPDLSRVDEVGWSGLMVGGGSDACTRVDWIEVYGKPVNR